MPACQHDSCTAEKPLVFKGLTQVQWLALCSLVPRLPRLPFPYMHEAHNKPVTIFSERDTGP